jgi:hypothetical protein
MRKLRWDSPAWLGFVFSIVASLRSSALRFGQVVNRSRENLREPTRQR